MNNCQKCHCFVGVLHSNAHEELFPASSFLTIEDKRIKTSSKTADSILFARSFSHLFPTVFSDMVTQLRSITYLPFLSSLSAAIEGLISKTKGYSFGLFEKPEKSSKLHAEICWDVFTWHEPFCFVTLSPGGKSLIRCWLTPFRIKQ